MCELFSGARLRFTVVANILSFNGSYFTEKEEMLGRKTKQKAFQTMKS